MSLGLKMNKNYAFHCKTKKFEIKIEKHRRWWMTEKKKRTINRDNIPTAIYKYLGEQNISWLIKLFNKINMSK